MRIRVFATGVLLLAATTAAAVVHEHESGGKLGEVHFATSCQPAAQGQFNRAVALLHSFQFSDAVDGFNQVLQKDPACGIAYWGIALSAWSNPLAPGKRTASQMQLGRESVEHGRQVGARTEREKAYIEAVGRLYTAPDATPQPVRFIAYRDAMEHVADSYPEDHEAQIFYALALAVADDARDTTYVDRRKAGAILEKLFAQEPTHPGLAHYIFHTYDVPALAPEALTAARRYAQIAPDAPHALHMPSHTFTRLGYWQESIDSNLAAAAAARRQHQTAEELHASDYETYAYLQTGRDREASQVLAALPEIASRFDPNAVLLGAGPPSAGYYALAAIPARYALERLDWQQAEKLSPSSSPFPQADALTWFARGLGAARLGHADAANEAAAALKQLQERLANSNETYWALQVQIQATAVSAWAAMAAGEADEALRQMQLATRLEDGTEKSVVSPGPLAPAHELLGEMFLQMHQPEHALEQFELTLTREPRRFRALYGAARSATLSGKDTAGRQYFAQILAVCARTDQPERPELTEARKAVARKG